VNALRTLAGVAAVGSGLMAGVYYGFSAIVMPGLRDMSATDGMRAMQVMNVAAPRPPLLIALMGTGAVSVGAIVAAAMNGGSARWWIIGGATLSLASLGITAAYNVPRNDVLAAVDALDPAAADVWVRYLREWTIGNHVRSAAAFAGAVMLTVGYRLT
jgi:uncharacterized membrane protein